MFITVGGWCVQRSVYLARELAHFLTGLCAGGSFATLTDSITTRKAFIGKHYTRQGRDNLQEPSLAKTHLEYEAEHRMCQQAMIS